MKNLLFNSCIVLALFCGCKGTKFSYQSDKDLMKLGKDSSFTIDSTYQLYMRQVLKDTSDDNLLVPVSSRDPRIGAVIEKQYMLISPEQKQVIIISNIPNKYQSFYNDPSEKAMLVITDQEDIDIWYFNQFRFGTLDTNNIIRFPGVIDGLPQIWNFKPDGEDLNLESLTEYDKDGNIVYLIEPAYAVQLIFYKIQKFRIVFKQKKMQMTDKLNKVRASDLPVYPLEDGSIHLINDGSKWYTYFKLKDFRSENRNILFDPKRMYAAPVLK